MLRGEPTPSLPNPSLTATRTPNLGGGQHGDGCHEREVDGHGELDHGHLVRFRVRVRARVRVRVRVRD